MEPYFKGIMLFSIFVTTIFYQKSIWFLKNYILVCQKAAWKSFFGHDADASTDYPILAKFCKSCGMSTKATRQNCQFQKSKMADGRHFDNREITISQ